MFETTKPLVYSVPLHLVPNFPDLRVVISHFQSELLQADPTLFAQVVELARHSHKVVTAVYAPLAKDMQAQSILQNYGSYIGLGEDDWFFAESDKELNEILAQPACC